MINREIHNLNKTLKTLRDIKNRQGKRALQLKGLESVSLKYRIHQSGKPYYYIRDDSGSLEYLGDESCEKVRNIKEAHYLKKSLSIIDRDISALEKTLKSITPIGYDDVNGRLPKAYRGARVNSTATADEKRRAWKEKALAYKSRFNVYKPEELKIPTNDGSKVRSRSEGYIYNLLNDLGVTFVYEMPIKIGSKVFWADFVILSEIDDTTEIIIEHQGLMDDSGYRERFNLS